MKELLNKLYLYDSNPRYINVKESKEKIKSINVDNLNEAHNENAAKKLIEYEGDYRDLLDLISSIIDRGFREKANPFYLLEKDDKYIVTDGNRRMLSLLLINKIITVEKIFPDNLKGKSFSNFKKIKDKINSYNGSITLTKKHHNIYKENEIEEMFKDILYKHTGSGNGKRDWPRGKMLKEIYEIYNNSRNHETGMEEVKQNLGVTKSKAESDIKSSVFVMTLINKFNEMHNKIVDPLKIAPSSTELILSTNFDKSIIDHQSNVNSSKNIKDLLNVKIEKDINQNEKYVLNLNELELINEKYLINLLIEGFIPSEISDNLEDFNGDDEKDNDENKGLLRNRFYTTRSWREQGTERLREYLNWPEGILPEEKILQIKEDNELVMNLTSKDILDKTTKSGLEEIFGHVTFKHIEKIVSEVREQQKASPRDLGKYNNHIWSVLNVIFSYEYTSLLRLTSKTPFPIDKKHVLSQLAVLRSMSEMLHRFLFFSCVNMVFENGKSIEEWVEKIKLEKPEQSEELLRLLKEIFIETDSGNLEIIFNNIYGSFGNRFFPNIEDVLNVTLDFIGDSELKTKYQSVRKVFGEMGKMNSSKGKSLSLPMHYIEKFISEKSFKTLVKLNLDFIEIEKLFIKIFNWIKEDIELLIYDDDKLKDFFID